MFGCLRGVSLFVLQSSTKWTPQGNELTNFGLQAPPPGEEVTFIHLNLRKFGHPLYNMFRRCASCGLQHARTALTSRP
jgi:hypothetical protein